MNKLIHFSKVDINKFLKSELESNSIGETIQSVPDSSNIYEDLLKLDVDYVILGIHENIGAFANRFVTDGKSLFKPILKALLNKHSTQEESLNHLAILGYLDFSKEIEAISNLNIKKFSDVKKARKLVQVIDSYVTKYIHDIIKAGKIPIIIGGGQNNAYGCIKGCSLAINKPINIINLDYYADFGREEGRHNGNGFSYAFSEGFLNKYFIQGLKEVNLSDFIFKRIFRLKKRIQYNTLESIKLRKEIGWRKSLKKSEKFINESPFGIEIDWRVVKSYTKDHTIIGLDYRDVSRFLDCFAGHNQVMFVHFAEINGYGLSKTDRKEISKSIANLVMNIVNHDS